MSTQIKYFLAQMCNIIIDVTDLLLLVYVHTLQVRTYLRTIIDLTAIF